MYATLVFIRNKKKNLRVLSNTSRSGETEHICFRESQTYIMMMTYTLDRHKWKGECSLGFRYLCGLASTDVYKATC